MVIWLNDLIMQNEGPLFYDSTNYNGEGGIIHSFVLLFRSRKRASKDFLTMPKMETMMEKAGGITNRFVLFLGSGNQAGQNHQTITKLEKTTGKGGGGETIDNQILPGLMA